MNELNAGSHSIDSGQLNAASLYQVWAHSSLKSQESCPKIVVTMFLQSPVCQWQIIVPAGRLMKVSAPFKHKVTSVWMHSKAVTIQKNALRGQRWGERPPLRWRPLWWSSISARATKPSTKDNEKARGVWPNVEPKPNQVLFTQTLTLLLSSSV